MPKQLWDRAEHGFLSDASGLISLGGIALWRGYSYLPMNVNVNRSPAHALEGLLSPPAWAAVWILIGIFCIIPIWVPRLLPLAVGIGVGLHVLWLISFMGVQITGETAALTSAQLITMASRFSSRGDSVEAENISM